MPAWPKGCGTEPVERAPGPPILHVADPARPTHARCGKPVAEMKPPHVTVRDGAESVDLCGTCRVFARWARENA
jgi:hypothetical protein